MRSSHCFAPPTRKPESREALVSADTGVLIAVFVSRSGQLPRNGKLRHQFSDGLLKVLRTKRADPALTEFARQGQHLARVSAAHRPFKQGSVLIEFNDIPQPLCAGCRRNYDHVRHITRPNTTANG